MTARGSEYGGTQRAAHPPSYGDVRQAAGFLEGEGCFYNNNGNLGIKAAQVNPEPLLRLAEIFGGSIKLLRKEEPSRDQLLWVITGSRARGVAMTIYQFMSAWRRAEIREYMPSRGGFSRGENPAEF